MCTARPRGAGPGCRRGLAMMAAGGARAGAGAVLANTSSGGGTATGALAAGGLNGTQSQAARMQLWSGPAPVVIAISSVAVATAVCAAMHHWQWSSVQIMEELTALEWSTVMTLVTGAGAAVVRLMPMGWRAVTEHRQQKRKTQEAKALAIRQEELVQKQVQRKQLATQQAEQLIANEQFESASGVVGLFIKTVEDEQWVGDPADMKDLRRLEAEADTGSSMKELREPLFTAAYDLQTRLWGFRPDYTKDYWEMTNRTSIASQYHVRYHSLHTPYLFGQLLYWFEFIRTSAILTRVGADDKAIRLQQAVNDVQSAMSSWWFTLKDDDGREDDGARDSGSQPRGIPAQPRRFDEGKGSVPDEEGETDTTFLVFKGDQRAIGALMAGSSTSGSPHHANTLRQCLGYDEFFARMLLEEASAKQMHDEAATDGPGR
eukprot:SAG22_NODE_3_length_48349_cov_158.681180_15_plen_432_part_00